MMSIFRIISLALLLSLGVASATSVFVAPAFASGGKDGKAP
jgi:hypothetical protein